MFLSPEKILVSRSYMAYGLQKNLGAKHKMVNQSKNPRFLKWWKIPIAPIFICGVKIQMPTVYISLQRNF